MDKDSSHLRTDKQEYFFSSYIHLHIDPMIQDFERRGFHTSTDSMAMNVAVSTSGADVALKSNIMRLPMLK